VAVSVKRPAQEAGRRGDERAAAIPSVGHRGASPTKPCKHVPNLPHQILGQNPKFQIWFLGYAGHILHIIVRYAPVGFYASPQNNRVIGVCTRFARAQIWFGHPRFGSMAG